MISVIAFPVMVYYGYFIFRSSFVIDGKRFFVLFDDAMISMDYAKSLYKGCGLVWFCGADKVEGFTNFGWTIYMYFIHILNLPKNITPLMVQITGAILLIASAYLLYLSSDKLKKGSGIFSFTILSLYMPAVYWSLTGMEVSAVLFLVSLSIYLYIRRKFAFIPFAMAIGTLIRMDFLLVAIVFLTILKPLKHRIITVILVFITLLSLTVFRVIYYGDILPNTFYLKASELNIYVYLRGLYSSLKHILIYNPFLYITAFSYCIKNRGSELVKPYIVGFVLILLYNIYVGGDVWESTFQSNRFFLNIIPFTVMLSSLYISNLRMPLPKIVLLLLSLTGIHPSRVRVFLDPSDEFHISYNERYVKKVLRVGEITRKGAKIGVVMAGIPPYYLEDRYFIDFLGKNDKYISKLKSRRIGNFLPFVKHLPPGHTKWDYSYSIGKLKPDVILAIWGIKYIPESEYKPYLRDYTFVKGLGFLRKNSDKVVLEKIFQP